MCVFLLTVLQTLSYLVVFISQSGVSSNLVLSFSLDIGPEAIEFGIQVRILRLDKSCVYSPEFIFRLDFHLLQLIILSTEIF